MGALNPRLDDTAQRLTWKIVSVLYASGGFDWRLTPRLDDTWQRLLWKWASLLFVAGSDAKNQPRPDDSEQRLLWKIANLVSPGGTFECCGSSAQQRLLYDIATALQSSPGVGPFITPPIISNPVAPPCTLPSSPVDLGAVAGIGSVTLSWTPSAGATGYNIKRSLLAGGPYTTVGTAAFSPYTDFAVVAGTTYNYVVTGTNACGEGVVSSMESHATPT
jgi:hypothetical protein